MHPWAKLAVESRHQTRWQRLKGWIFGKPEQVQLTAEIAHGVIAEVVEDRASLAAGRAATR